MIESHPPANGDWVPRPDPTLRTIETLAHDLSGLRELIETRLDAYDKAISLLQLTANRSPTPAELDVDLNGFKILAEEKFQGIKDSIQQRDVRLGQAEQAAKDAVTTAFTGSEKAVAAALQAAKEAVGAQSESFDRATTKAEAATTKLLDALNVQISTSAAGLDGKIGDVKDSMNKLDVRLSNVESRGFFVKEAQGQNNWNVSAVISVLGVLVALISLIVVLTKVL
jgi:hypothetical protein